VTTLAPAFEQSLPSLDRVPARYSHEFHAELLFELCAAMAREGLGTPETWQKCDGNAVAFAESAIRAGIGEERSDLLRRNVDYHLLVSDFTERDGYDVRLDDGRLIVIIECSGAGYLKIGPAVEALEKEHDGLGAAFYWTLTYALYRVMRLYNHDDALRYEEGMREMAEQETDGSLDQYEFPEVEKALPESIRNTLRHRRKGWSLRARRLLLRHKRGKYSSWIDRLRRIQRLSRLPLRQSRQLEHEGNYDSPPLPALFVPFQDHDAITACFDEEGQYMLEGSSEPTLSVVFSPHKPEEVRNALRIVWRFVALNDELFQLVEELEGWEIRNEGPCLDRGEPSLRTA